jgi:hypothetical protein
MMTEIDLVKDSTMQETNRILTLIAGKEGGFTPKSWKDVQAIVRLGLADKYFSIGDQFVVEKETAITATIGNTNGETPGITSATVNADTFINEIGTAHNGDYEFVYDGADWHYGDTAVSLAAYGITVAGTAKLGDAVVVHETANKFVFDVIGIDHDTPADSQFKHSITLQLHDLYQNIQFDGTEAIYYAREELPAGTYNFTLPAGYDMENGGGKTYQFTITKPVPAAGQIMFPWAYQQQASATKVSTYVNANASAVIETVSVQEGSEGTSLGTADGTVSDLNHIQRARYGSNNWAESDLRMRLNSSAAPGGTWTRQSKFSHKPFWADTESGFLRGVDPDFISVLGEVTKVTALNTLTDGGGSKTSTEKIFLLSRSEVYGNFENSVDEGAAYPYYKNYSDFASKNDGNDTNRIKYQSNGTPSYWWLRTPFTGDANHVRNVIPTGAISGNGASGSYGLAPACCIV